MSKLRILWLATRWPDPANTGAKRATNVLIKYLFQENDLYLGLTESGEGVWNYPGQALAMPRFIPRAKKYIKLFFSKLRHPFLPLSYLLYVQYQSQASKELQVLECEYLVIDGLHSWALRPSGQLKAQKMIYRSHNVEANIWYQRYSKETNRLKKIVYYFEYLQMRDLERSLIQRADLTFTVSKQDQSDYLKLSSQSNIQVLPIGFEFNPLNLKNADRDLLTSPLELLFVGRLDWYPNQEGLIWFLNEVWPQINSKKFNLVIVGSGVADYLKPFLQRFRNLSYFSNLPTLDRVYEKCDITLIPLFSGGGTRVKAIEAASFSRSFLSTDLGVEGLDLDPQSHYIKVSDQAADWIEAINHITANLCQTKAQSLYHFMREHYSALDLAKQAKIRMEITD